MRVAARILIGVMLVVFSFVLARRLGLLSGPRPVVPAAAPETVAAPPPPAPESQPLVQTPVSTAPAPPAEDPPLVPPPPVERIQWEQSIDDVLMADADAPQKAQKLLELYPAMPEAGQVEAVQHLANLLPDTNFTAVAHLLTNALTPQGVVDVLVGDLLNRPNKVKLPLMLDVARAAGHPWRAEAKQMLEMYVERDFGDDWTAWDQAVQTWLKENPD
jgi:hypothetical protein